MLLFFCFFLAPQNVIAFEGIKTFDQKTWQLGVTMGTLLPFGITGVRDQYGGWGAYLSQPGYIFSAFDYMVYGFVDKGVTFYDYAIAGRVDFSLYEVVNGYVRFGLDYNYYKRKASQVREYDFAGVVGSHIGFGSYHEVSSEIKFRSDFKFSFGPGTYLYAGLGVTYTLGASSEGNEQ